MPHARISRDGESPTAGQGPVALVTGGSRGLGLLIARELLARGCRVLVCGRDQDNLSAARALLRAGTRDPDHVEALTCDVTEPGAAERLLGAVHERFGRLDVLVNNAGTIQVGPVEAMDEQAFRDAVETLCFAPLRLTLAALPDLREARGRLVNITSIGGQVAAPHLLPYTVGKFAATGLSQGLRAELAAQGVSVTTVVPGLMRTGSHQAALFRGDSRREYAWFATAACLPGLSMSAERAARAIVDAAQARRPQLVLTPAAKAMVKFHALAPATAQRALSLTARLLPDAADPEQLPPEQPGAEARLQFGTGLVDRLTALGDRAAVRLNQVPPFRSTHEERGA
ncbi:SDR family NAD(P)-dependent oxidoreductase [Streptacidiphilus neutrinimicus]|uniref:SDR family NAD(P)-dependent oxidoreductase n=1 Tax=Streptacidiphilus neutrinimicus TaxID=105420 RepID=UPI001F18CBF2|nr:SDR family NAD(P)-dependent oxidoreductase [Streptacidiphilus neutrinimicus]